MQLLNIDTNSLIFIVLLIPFIVGITMGCANKITIFNNLDDLLFTFLMLILPIPMLYIAHLFNDSKLIFYFFMIIELIMFLYLSYKSFIDNQKNIFYTILALYTKLPLSLIYLINILSVLDNIFYKEKKHKNVLAVILFTILTAIIAKLVKNNPRASKQYMYQIKRG